MEIINDKLVRVSNKKVIRIIKTRMTHLFD
jgi:hypothetical protein